ncbi:MAG: hypothetical protein IPK26_18845 [Planctomycetes bacterium]|nr:hypothetical protein [Planctomycetota bacterium]
MTCLHPRSALLLLALCAAPSVAQDWNDDQLTQQIQGFLDDSLKVKLQQVGKLLEHQKEAFAAMRARIHGDHREYMLKIERLLSELSDDRWSVREEAERTLVEVGGRARAVIQARTEKFETLEESIRCRRVLELIAAKGTEQEERETDMLRGLVLTTLYMPAEPTLMQALRSALGHTDPLVVDYAIRSLGAHGDDEAADAVKQMLGWKAGIYRGATLGALARMPCPRALAICQELLAGTELSRPEACAMIRTLRTRSDSAALVAATGSHQDPVVAAAAKVPMPEALPDAATARFTLPDRSTLDAKFGGFLGDASIVIDGIEGLPRAELPFADCDIVEFPGHEIGKPVGARVFLNQGSLVLGELQAIDPESVRVKSPVFGELTLLRKDVQGLAVDPELDRLVGASPDHDRVRLKTNEFIDGSVVSIANGKVTVKHADGSDRVVDLTDVAGVMMTRPRAVEPDNTVYTRIDLTTGDRIIGFLAGSTPTHLGISAPQLGAAVVPITQVARLELGVGGGAMWGFTLIADYSDNRIVEVDDQQRIVFVVDDVFGAWDAECLDNGNLLITEFSVSRVQEVDRKGKQIWVFEDLKNPYDADRLLNGNTLIADTFGSRVIEVNPEGKIVWKFDKEIRPFDCDRLPNGNTLIADVLKDRVIEVSSSGEVVWEVKNMNNVHDADRLPNGNTLITLRSKGAVVEVDRDGKVVWELNGLSSPSDADRLPNGNTVVAENTQVREFDRRKNIIWKKEMTWAVEVNRY